MILLGVRIWRFLHLRECDLILQQSTTADKLTEEPLKFARVNRVNFRMSLFLERRLLLHVSIYHMVFYVISAWLWPYLLRIEELASILSRAIATDVKMKAKPCRGDVWQSNFRLLRVISNVEFQLCQHA